MDYLMYQIKISVLISLFYLIYQIIYFDNSFHFKRIILLTILVLSVIVPLIQINTHKIINNNFVTYLPEVIVNVNSKVKVLQLNFNIWLKSLLIIISTVYLIQLISQFCKIFVLKNKSELTYFKSYKLFKHNGYGSFTFFKYLFISRHEEEVNSEVIIQHELIHAKKLHSIDILLVDLLIIFQWFNPFIWLLKKAIKENHEFEVDSNILKQGIDIDIYKNLLINSLFKTTRFNFSSFKHSSLIKNRIKMMTQIPKAGKTRFLLATVLSFILVATFAFKSEHEIPDLSKLEVVNLNNEQTGGSLNQKDTVKKDVILLIPEKPATFHGKDLKSFMEYVNSEIVYPKEAIANKEQGKVYINFIVDFDGKVTNVNVLRGASHDLDVEAVRVIKNSPVWTPAMDKGALVKQFFTIPVVFKLQR